MRSDALQTSETFTIGYSGSPESSSYHIVCEELFIGKFKPPYQCFVLSYVEAKCLRSCASPTNCSLNSRCCSCPRPFLNFSRQIVPSALVTRSFRRWFFLVLLNSLQHCKGWNQSHASTFIHYTVWIHIVRINYLCKRETRMSDLGNLQSFLIQFLKSEIGNISASKSLATCFGCFSESAVNFSRDLQKRTNTWTRHGSPMSPCILLLNLSLTIILFIFKPELGLRMIPWDHNCKD